MATSKLSQLQSLGGGEKPKPKPSLPPATEAQLKKFGDFAGSGDSKTIASYLIKKGLINGSQLYTDHPDISTKEGIINAQSDWKPAAISKMLIRARQLNLKTPTEIKANQEALLGSLDERLSQAIKHPTFSQIHGNWWETFNSILKDQYASENASQPLPSLATALATK